ncbi:protein translocase subunit SecD [Apibacter muscae]|uniref:protein translocase subunit SecD n=1 Tax=Apibacter muscae TaxID=2509004 RepID=UPI0011AD2119|nr:protein translocase subunit SecD [Apibacter muscae]TWP23484.1 protein translocase subunit SecD [Apibacter muscae]
MKGKGLVKFFAIALAIICLIELLPTIYVNLLESRAEKNSKGDETKRKAEIEKLAKDTLNLGIVKMDYQSAKEKEIKLGLDLKGGLNLLLEISEKDLLVDLADNTENPVFNKAIEIASSEANTSNNTFTQNFFKAFQKAKQELGQPNLKLSSPEIFGTKELSGVIQHNTSDSEVEKYITSSIESKVSNAIDIIRTRITKLKIDEPNISRVPGTGRILVELPGVTDTDRVKNLLQTSARLEFWEVVEKSSAWNMLTYINLKAADKQLMGKLIQAPNSTAVALAKLSDTATINRIINSDKAKNILRYNKLLWSSEPDSNNLLELYAIKGTRNNKAPLVGAVSDAQLTFDQFNRIQIAMQMGPESSIEWKKLTEKNAPKPGEPSGKPIAVVLDDIVYTAPVVNSVIPNGQSVISGNYSEQKASDLVDVLKAGNLPAKANILQSEVVGPTLGQQSITNGLISILVSYIFILIWMVFYYGKAGIYANIALVINLFYLIGIMASWGSVLTLPGIAGIVLSMAMAVDANIIIFERIKEELRKGKPLKQAFIEGQKHALAAIIDGNLTTLIVGCVLLFSTGPIKGFAVTLVIGIFCTLFTAIFITGMLIYGAMEKGQQFSLTTRFTKNWFMNVNYKWMEKRKLAYIFSLILMVVALISIFTKGFDKGVDYTGGRTYVIKLNKEIHPEVVSESLEKIFTVGGESSNINAKQYGGKDQLRITTKYGLGDNNPNIDLSIREKLYTGLKEYLPKGYSKEEFINGSPYGIQSASEVGPTVASGIVKNGIIAVSIALAGIFIYILVRFKNWQMSTGAVVALFHDAVIVMGAFSVLSWLKIIPFSVEIDQSFIAAILTIIGYSINDTVIVFDRIRENKNLNLARTMTLEELYNDAINHTLGRTINTGISTIMVTVIIFLFGGESLQGFMFALFLGFTFGMYSSIYIASSLSYDLTRRSYDQAKAKLKESVL